MTGEGVFYGVNGDIMTKSADDIFKFISGTGWAYSGSFNEWGQTGTGRFIFPDGAVYEGAFTRGLADGFGVFSAPGGWSYEGNFKNGLFSGDGKLTNSDGTVKNVVFGDFTRD